MLKTQYSVAFDVITLGLLLKHCLLDGNLGLGQCHHLVAESCGNFLEGLSASLQTDQQRSFSQFYLMRTSGK